MLCFLEFAASNSKIDGDSAPFRVIQDTALLLGDIAILALTLIMGGNLLKGLNDSRIKKSIILHILIVRYLVMPPIGVCIVKGAARFGLVHNNPLYQSFFCCSFHFHLKLTLVHHYIGCVLSLRVTNHGCEIGAINVFYCVRTTNCMSISSSSVGILRAA